jgi:hypothetical protein
MNALRNVNSHTRTELRSFYGIFIPNCFIPFVRIEWSTMSLAVSDEKVLFLKAFRETFPAAIIERIPEIELFRGNRSILSEFLLGYFL